MHCQHTPVPEHTQPCTMWCAKHASLPRKDWKITASSWTPPISLQPVLTSSVFLAQDRIWRCWEWGTQNQEPTAEANLQPAQWKHWVCGHMITAESYFDHFSNRSTSQTGNHNCSTKKSCSTLHKNQWFVSFIGILLPVLLHYLQNIIILLPLHTIAITPSI
jgi:hypothetical protein